MAALIWLQTGQVSCITIIMNASPLDC